MYKYASAAVLLWL